MLRRSRCDAGRLSGDIRRPVVVHPVGRGMAGWNECLVSHSAFGRCKPEAVGGQQSGSLYVGPIEVADVGSRYSRVA